MEVHHHPHVPHHSKPWKEYLIEGLMIFIAVTMGYGAENIREHFLETRKSVISAQNLYKDVLDDSVNFEFITSRRRTQDSCFGLLDSLYENKIVLNHIPLVYAAHSYFSRRLMPTMNDMALDEIKSSGNLNFIEDQNLKRCIQNYASSNIGLKIREQREFSFLDKMIDPLTINSFKYKPYHQIQNHFKVKGYSISITANIPADLKLNKQESFDWDAYYSVLGMLKTIRNSTDKSYIVPAQAKCHELLTALRHFLMEHKALSEK